MTRFHHHAAPLIIALAMQLSTGFAVAAESNARQIPARELPPPAAASEELAASIIAMPVLAVGTADGPPSSREEMLANIAAANQAPRPPLEMLEQIAGVSIERDNIAGVRVYHVVPAQIAPEHANHLFLHVHGGGYVLGGGDASVSEAVLVAGAAGIRALSVDYRMPPEAPFPAAVDDTIAVYREMLQSYDAGQIAIGGTSAGGGLSFASILRMKELGLPVPGAVFAGTPWADLTQTSDTLYTNQNIDRVLVSYAGFLEQSALLYADGEDLRHPLISPLYGDFSGFPPTILISGTRDLLLSDTARAHRKLRDAGVIADLHVFEGVSHADYLIVGNSPESASTFSEISRFFKSHLN